MSAETLQSDEIKSHMYKIYTVNPIDRGDSDDNFSSIVKDQFLSIRKGDYANGQFKITIE
ncbi:MAG: hypothetical protein HDT47_10575 [Ruminococcaceae bacterium]|nr:hypothetical protein [Oscillospiraceae bacterium]